MNRFQFSRSRSGMLLIIALGLAAIMAGLMLSFVSRIRMSTRESVLIEAQAQCRLMLAAACLYIQESSRLGWDDPSTAQHEEAFGWVDVRDGQIGPKTWAATPGGTDYRLCFNPAAVDALGRPSWPAVGGILRAPMYVMERPPWAIAINATPNPLDNGRLPGDPLFGVPLLRRPDPQPIFATSAVPASTAVAWQQFRDGNRLARAQSTNRGWMRIFRESPATFVVTVGSGASLGYRDWAEVQAFAGDADFLNDSTVFTEIANDEIRLWYRLEWSPAIGGADGGLLTHENKPDLEQWGTGSGQIDQFQWLDGNIPAAPFSKIPNTGSPGSIEDPHALQVNQGGTIAWIQRLIAAPEQW